MQLRGVSVVSMLAIHAEGIKSMKTTSKKYAILNFRSTCEDLGFGRLPGCVGDLFFSSLRGLVFASFSC